MTVMVRIGNADRRERVDDSRCVDITADPRYILLCWTAIIIINTIYGQITDNSLSYPLSAGYGPMAMTLDFESEHSV
jgi:hypothetical protein